MQKAANVATRWPPSTPRSQVHLGMPVALPLDVRYTVSSKLSEKTGILSINGVLLYVDQKGNGSSVLHIVEIQHNGSDRGISAKAHFESKLFKSLSTARSAVLGLQTRPSGWGFFSTETAETERGRAVSKPLNLWKGPNGIALTNCLDRNPYYSGEYPIATSLVWDEDNDFSVSDRKEKKIWTGSSRPAGLSRRKRMVECNSNESQPTHKSKKMNLLLHSSPFEPKAEEKAVVIDFFQSLLEFSKNVNNVNETKNQKKEYIFCVKTDPYNNDDHYVDKSLTASDRAESSGSSELTVIKTDREIVGLQ